jgi:hypothetical protein
MRFGADFSGRDGGETQQAKEATGLSTMPLSRLNVDRQELTLTLTLGIPVLCFFTCQA